MGQQETEVKAIWTCMGHGRPVLAFIQSSQSCTVEPVSPLMISVASFLEKTVESKIQENPQQLLLPRTNWLELSSAPVARARLVVLHSVGVPLIANLASTTKESSK